MKRKKNSKEDWTQSKPKALLFTVVGVLLLLLGNSILDARESNVNVSLAPEYDDPKPFHYVPKGPDPRVKSKRSPVPEYTMDDEEFEEYLREFIGDEYDLTPKEYGREQQGK